GVGAVRRAVGRRVGGAGVPAARARQIVCSFRSKIGRARPYLLPPSIRGAADAGRRRRAERPVAHAGAHAREEAAPRFPRVHAIEWLSRSVRGSQPGGESESVMNGHEKYERLIDEVIVGELPTASWQE